MNNEQNKASNKVYFNKVCSVLAPWLYEATADIAEQVIDTVLAGELNEAAPPAMKYYIEFYALSGFSALKKETAHENYKDGDFVKYNNIVWEVKNTITCEDEGRTSVVFGAYQMREN